MIFRVVEKTMIPKVSSNDYINYIAVLIIVFFGAAAFAFLANKALSKLLKY